MNDRITALRHELHALAEPSGAETKTKERLKRFLSENTSLELIDCGGGFYAAHRESDISKPSIALRADFDALMLPDGGCAHLCGHDGHSAALCGLALRLEGKKLGRDIFLLFQPAEETGAGALGCLGFLEREKPEEIYAAHNLPGFELGRVFTRAGTFACASRGLTLKFSGRAAHAAYPELGVSPAAAVGELLGLVTKPADNADGMVLCTVIGVQMGERAFGAAAAGAEVWLTLRAEHDSELKKLYDRIIGASEKLAAGYSLGFAFEDCDVFPSTENYPEAAKKVLTLCGGAELEAPMRWSEDFGWYLKACRGAFFGIGAGISHAPLHSECYEYPDELLGLTADAFEKLILG